MQRWNLLFLFVSFPPLFLAPPHFTGQLNPMVVEEGNRQEGVLSVRTIRASCRLRQGPSLPTITDYPSKPTQSRPPQPLAGYDSETGRCLH